MPRTHRVSAQRLSPQRVSPPRKQGSALRALTIGLLGGLAFAANASAAPDTPSILAEAESAFTRGKNTEDPAKARAEFARAATLYAQIHAHNASLCLNEGNAHVLAGAVPQAILAYQRGLRLAPNDARLRDNLAYARQRVAYPGEHGRPPPSAWPPWLPRPSIELLITLAAVFY